MSFIIEGGVDLARYGTISVTINEVGGAGSHAVTISTGTYFPETSATGAVRSDDNGADVSAGVTYASMVAALNAATLAAGFVSTITWSITAAGKWRISSNGAFGVTSLSLTFPAGATAAYFGSLGGTYTGALAYTLNGYASRYIIGAQGGVRDLIEPREAGEDLATEILSEDGTEIEGIAQPGAPREFLFTVPSEPRARVWHVDSTTNGSWELFFRQVRNVEPILVRIVDNVTRKYVGRLKKDTCAFRPTLVSKDYLEIADIDIEAWQLGRVP